MSKAVHYSILDAGILSEREGVLELPQWDTLPLPDGHVLAEWCAEAYCRDYGGSNKEWPMTFRLSDGNGNSFGDYEVEIDYEPTFIVSKAA